MKRQVTFTLRLNPAFYQRIKAVSAREGKSVTAFMQEAVAKKLDEEAAASLFQAFTLVGEDMAEASVEFASHAQREVALKDA